MPDRYDAKIAKICNLWTFWPVMALSLGTKGGATTFFCLSKSQECHWQDWYILLYFDRIGLDDGGDLWTTHFLRDFGDIHHRIFNEK